MVGLRGQSSTSLGPGSSAEREPGSSARTGVGPGVTNRREGTAMSYQRILVGVDGSDQADRAFDKACELAKSISAKVFVVEVVDGDRIAHSPYGGEIAYFEQETARANTAIESYIKRGREASVDIEGEVVTGSASHLLAHELPTKYSADLIVLGTTGLSAIERLLLGSRSNFVLRNASTDVLIVR